jgi:hypothetical protein
MTIGKLASLLFKKPQKSKKCSRHDFNSAACNLMIIAHAKIYIPIKNEHFGAGRGPPQPTHSSAPVSFLTAAVLWLKVIRIHNKYLSCPNSTVTKQTYTTFVSSSVPKTLVSIIYFF